MEKNVFMKVETINDMLIRSDNILNLRVIPAERRGACIPIEIHKVMQISRQSVMASRYITQLSAMRVSFFVLTNVLKKEGGVIRLSFVVNNNNEGLLCITL